MKKVNVHELTGKLNQFRMNNENKTFSGDELHKQIVGLGFSNGIAYKITSKCFPFEPVGKGRLYEMPSKSINETLVASLYKSQAKYSEKVYNKKKEITTQVKTEADKFREAKEENDAIKLLLSKGYKIQRPLGLDVKQLLKDHPEMEKIYMRYTTL